MYVMLLNFLLWTQDVIVRSSTLYVIINTHSGTHDRPGRPINYSVRSMYGVQSHHILYNIGRRAFSIIWMYTYIRSTRDEYS